MPLKLYSSKILKRTPSWTDLNPLCFNTNRASLLSSWNQQANAVWYHYNAVSFSQIVTTNTSNLVHDMGVFCEFKSDLCCAAVIAKLYHVYILSWYIGPRYNGRTSNALLPNKFRNLSPALHMIHFKRKKPWLISEVDMKLYKKQIITTVRILANDLNCIRYPSIVVDKAERRMKIADILQTTFSHAYPFNWNLPGFYT